MVPPMRETTANLMSDRLIGYPPCTRKGYHTDIDQYTKWLELTVDRDPLGPEGSRKASELFDRTRRSAGAKKLLQGPDSQFRCDQEQSAERNIRAPIDRVEETIDAVVADVLRQACQAESLLLG